MKNLEEMTAEEIIELAKKMRPYIEKAAQSLSKKEALEAVLLYPRWEDFIGKKMEQGTRISYDGKLWCSREVINPVLAQYPPSIHTAASYEQVVIDILGTYKDPIPYEDTLKVYKGKYYIENKIIYLCIRASGKEPDEGKVFYQSCSNLLNSYFVIAQDPDQIPAWKQPAGALDAYEKGFMVMHKGQKWRSLVSSNTWEPGAVGSESLWQKVEE